jgi:hypothetical protein
MCRWVDAIVAATWPVRDEFKKVLFCFDDLVNVGVGDHGRGTERSPEKTRGVVVWEFLRPTAATKTQT